MVNNCSVVQAFGALNLQAAQAMESLTGFGGGDGRAMLDLDEHEMLLQIAGDEAVLARKPDYLSDPAFAGQFDRNPFHDPDRQIMPPPPPKIRLDARAAPSMQQRASPRPEGAEAASQGASGVDGAEIEQALASKRRAQGERLRSALIGASSTKA